MHAGDFQRRLLLLLFGGLAERSALEVVVQVVRLLLLARLSSSLNVRLQWCTSQSPNVLLSYF
jgi:hypothetical protein